MIVKSLEPLVSVIIPVYNVLPYLRESLDSVIHQTYRNLEIIIIDDGSSDGSGEICDEYGADPRVKIIHRGKGGLSAARNTGLDFMTGDYVCFFDSDDVLHTDAIKSLLTALEPEKGDMAVSGYEIYETEGLLTEARNNREVVTKDKIILSGKDAFGYFLHGGFSASVCYKLYSREVWDHLRFAEGCVYEDLMIFPQVMEKCNRIIIVPNVLYQYRIREGSITHTQSIDNMNDFASAYRGIIEYAERSKPPFSPKDIQSYKENTVRKLIFKWARLREKGNMIAEADILSDTIHELSEENTDGYCAKTKAAWWLYKYCPQMLLTARVLFRKMKGVSGKW